ncbi:MAG: hypothetical protein Q8942_19525 [Bacillota bacterium]|nr:hypothetical protein [Bacillota bacterium]
MKNKLLLKKLFGISFLSLCLIFSFALNAFAETSFTDTDGTTYVFEKSGEPKRIKIAGTYGDIVEKTIYQATLVPGSTRTVTINQSYDVSSSVSTEQITKFMVDANLKASASANYGGLSATATLTSDLSYQYNKEVKNQNSRTYSEKISQVDTYTFDPQMAAQGYNNYIIYTGILYDVYELPLKQYKISNVQKQEQETYWAVKWIPFVGPVPYKATRTVTKTVTEKTFVKDLTIEIKEPIPVVATHYIKAALLKSSLDSNPQMLDNVSAINRPSVFQHIDYQGYQAVLPVGKLTLTDLNNLGVYDNDITAIKVPVGYEVVIYQNDNFSGNSLVLNSNCTTLANIIMSGTTSWNDQISSIEVRKII